MRGAGRDPKTEPNKPNGRGGVFSGVSAEADELPNGLERGGEKDRPKVLGGGVPLPLDPPVLLEGANGRENGLGRCCGGGGEVFRCCWVRLNRPKDCHYRFR